MNDTQGDAAVKLSTWKLDELPAQATYALERSASSVIRSTRIAPPGFSLWLVVSDLAAGGTLEWPARHGDEALCVLAGEVQIGGLRCQAGGAVIVEADVPCTIVATTDVRLAHYGPTDIAPPTDGRHGPARPDGHGVHVVGANGRFQTDDARYTQTWWADSTCPTCRISAFRVERPAGSSPDQPHSHSEDEIIFVLEGELRLGAHRCPPGTAIAIPGDLRYLLRSDGQGYAFLNYRRDASAITLAGGEPVSEDALDIFGHETHDERWIGRDHLLDAASH